MQNLYKKCSKETKGRKYMARYNKKFNIVIAILKNKQFYSAPKIILYFGCTNIIFAN